MGMGMTTLKTQQNLQGLLPECTMGESKPEVNPTNVVNPVKLMASGRNITTWEMGLRASAIIQEVLGGAESGDARLRRGWSSQDADPYLNPTKTGMLRWIWQGVHVLP